MKEDIVLCRQKKEVLNIMSHAMVRIRSMARNPENLKLIEELADSLHNIPRMIAENSAENDREIERTLEAVKILLI
ncbi:hypothetical protein [Teredinibacter purpureus]|uniref:hypothetical protein n=1 Tax=Teredinibacter purpureus TaxID=2731756 RepID=UPI0005F81AB3|nr:hypothetical protein [Teredinibacter purpureus]